jgi:alanine racemase
MIVSIEYLDVYNRNLSNTKAYVLTRLSKIPILGNVCMALTILKIRKLCEYNFL